MARTSSTMLALGTKMPEFSLPNIDGKNISSAQFTGKAMLVMFLSNHCPFVKHIRAKLAEIGKEYQGKGLGIVGICSNDIISHPDDSPEKMKIEAKDAGYTFPYLFDESQMAAKAFCAACTPDFFLFDARHILVYRGQLDDSRPGNGAPVSGKDLIQAIDLLLSGKPIGTEQKPSLGCNIKWKPGNEPDYYS